MRQVSLLSSRNNGRSATVSLSRQTTPSPKNKENPMAKGQSLQDPFLNALRKERVPVSIYLVNGIKLQGQIETGTRSLRSEEHTSELQSRVDLVCRLLLEKKKTAIV